MEKHPEVGGRSLDGGVSGKMPSKQMGKEGRGGPGALLVERNAPPRRRPGEIGWMSGSSEVKGLEGAQGRRARRPDGAAGAATSFQKGRRRLPSNASTRRPALRGNPGAARVVNFPRLEKGAPPNYNSQEAPRTPPAHCGVRKVLRSKVGTASLNYNSQEASRTPRLRTEAI